MRLSKFLKTGIIVFLTLAFLLVPVFANAQGPGEPAPEDNSCEGRTPDVLCRIVTKLLHVPLVFSSWLLGLSGVVLNLVLKFSVIEMSQNISGITGINIAWKVIRDITNMLFIFVLLYVAIQTILGLGSGSLKKTLVLVIVAALLINFSLFFTKVIIDASNLIALTFYERVAPGAGSDTLGAGISNKYMEPLGLTSFFDLKGSTGALAQYGLDIPKTFIVSVGGSIFLIITAFVFLAVSLMFLIRYVNIIFLLILSPVFFLGLVLPGFGSNLKSKWAESLSSQAIFAPVFMILTWMVITIINSGNFFGTLGSPATTSTNAAGAIGAGLSNLYDDQSSNPSAFGLIVNFIIIIAFAIATLVISKMVANQGGSVGAKVVGGALGFSAFAGRQTIGRAAKNVAEMDDLKKAAAEKKGVSGFTARMALKSAQATSKGSLDLRGGMTAVGGGLGFDKKGADLGLGSAGGKGGYEAIHKKKVEKMKEFGDSLGPSESTKVEAKQELERVKSIDKNDPRFQKEHQNEKGKRTAEYEDDQRRLNQLRTEYQTKGALMNPVDKAKYESEIKRREEKTQNSKDKVKEVETVDNYHELKKKEAQSKVDELYGVDRKEADRRKREVDTQKKTDKERLEKEMEAEIGQIDKSAVEAANAFAKSLENEVAQMEREASESRIILSADDEDARTERIENKKRELERANTDAQNKQIDYDAKAGVVIDKYTKQGVETDSYYAKRKESIQEVDDAEKLRKDSYADVITSRGVVGINEVPFSRKILRANVEAASKLKKKDKKVEDLVKEALKKNKEMEDEPEASSGGETGGGESEEEIK